MTQWDASFHERIAGEIKRLRDPRSAQWLADRTVELGYPISRAQIANYESGRKKGLDLAEFLVIAAALNTSPVTLIYPGPYEESVELVPGCEVTKFAAAQWFSGISRILGLVDETPSGGLDIGAIVDWDSATEELSLWRRLMDRELARSQAVIQMAHAGKVDRQGREIIAMYDKDIHEMRQDLGLSDDVRTSRTARRDNPGQPEKGASGG